MDKIAPLVLIPLLLTFLSFESIGNLELVQIYATVLLALLQFGFIQFYSYQVSRITYNERGYIIGSFYLVQGIAFILVSFTYVIITFVIDLFNIQKYSVLDFYIILILYPFFSSLYVSTIETIKLEKNRIGLVVILSVFSRVIVELFLTYAFLTLEFGWKSRVFAIALANFFFLIPMLNWLSSQYYFKAKKEIISEWIRFGFNTVIFRLSGISMNYSNRAFIIAFLGMEALGVYGIAVRVASPILVLGNILKTQWSNLVFNNPTTYSKRSIYRMVGVVFVVSGFYLTMVYFAKEIIGLSLMLYTFSFAVVLTNILQVTYWLTSVKKLQDYGSIFLRRVGLLVLVFTLIANYICIGKMQELGIYLAGFMSWLFWVIIVQLYGVSIWKN